MTLGLAHRQDCLPTCYEPVITPHCWPFAGPEWSTWKDFLVGREVIKQDDQGKQVTGVVYLRLTTDASVDEGKGTKLDKYAVSTITIDLHTCVLQSYSHMGEWCMHGLEGACSKYRFAPVCWLLHAQGNLSCTLYQDPRQ